MQTTSQQSSISADKVGDDMVDEILRADLLGMDIEEYLVARSQGATHEEIVTCYFSGVHVDTYADARRVGITHDQLLAYVACTTTGHDQHLRYATASVSAGATMIQVLSIARVGHSVKSYSALRTRGVSHENAHALLEHSGASYSVHSYCELHDAGIPHPEAIDALANTQRVALYINKRKQGITHAVAMKSLTDWP
jgi:hypothetical protein